MPEDFPVKVKRVHDKINAILQEEGMVLIPTISIAERESEVKDVIVKPNPKIITPI